MSITRIYQNSAFKQGQLACLDQKAFQHVVHSLRLKTGEEMILFNGQGGEYRANIRQIKRREITVEIIQFNACERESSIKIHLGQAMINASQMDLLIQKSVELGVTTITPLITERLATRLTSDRIQKKLNHWRGIIIAACEQCGRNRLPQLFEVMTLRQWISGSRVLTRLLLHPTGGGSVTSISMINQEIDLMVGPEGGLSNEEVELAEQNGFHTIYLGQRILRAETATIAAISILQHHWGDLKP